MDCYICLDCPDPNVPLLKCGHYVCPPCYCSLKNHQFFDCQLCKKKLIRGHKRNRIKKTI